MVWLQTLSLPISSLLSHLIVYIFFPSSSVYNGENILFSVSCLWIKSDTFMGCLWVQVWGSKLQWCSSCCLVVSIKNSFSGPRCLIFLQYSCIHTCCVCICIQAYLILPLFLFALSLGNCFVFFIHRKPTEAVGLSKGESLGHNKFPICHKTFAFTPFIAIPKSGS